MKNLMCVLIALLLLAGLSSFKHTAARDAEKPRCYVHYLELQTEWVPIKYGLIYRDSNYLNARKKLFPYSNKTYVAGSYRTQYSAQFKKVHFCAKCRSAEYLWKKAHPARIAPAPISPGPHTIQVIRGNTIQLEKH